jgi:hypothetical protein
MSTKEERFEELLAEPALVVYGSPNPWRLRSRIRKYTGIDAYVVKVFGEPVVLILGTREAVDHLLQEDRRKP